MLLKNKNLATKSHFLEIFLANADEKFFGKNINR